MATWRSTCSHLTPCSGAHVPWTGLHDEMEPSHQSVQDQGQSQPWFVNWPFPRPPHTTKHPREGPEIAISMRHFYVCTLWRPNACPGPVCDVCLHARLLHRRKFAPHKTKLQNYLELSIVITGKRPKKCWLAENASSVIPDSRNRQPGLSLVPPCAACFRLKVGT